MPGLVGSISNNSVNNISKSDVLRRMTDSVTHFDDYNTATLSFKNSSISFGLVSLGIINFPTQKYTCTEQKIHVLLDGEIVNINELIKGNFPNIDFSNNGAKLVCHFFIHDRTCQFLQKLNGWFNISIYDEINDRFILASDKFGFKPLYYKFEKEQLLFSAEVKAILKASSENNKLDEISIADYFAYKGILNERTLFENIFRFPPASFWIYNKNSWKKNLYWKADVNNVNQSLREESLFQNFNDIFKKIIKRYFKDDYSISLTGGWDTRTLMSLLPFSGRAPKSCFTYGVSKNSADNIVSKKIAKIFNLNHNFYPFGEDFFKNFPDFAEKAIWITDGMGDISATSAYYVHQYHRNIICVGGKYANQIALSDNPHKKYSMTKLNSIKYLNDDFYQYVQKISKRNLNTIHKKYDSSNIQANNDLLFAIYELCRRYWGDRVSIENSMFLLRTPYADNEFLEFLMQIPQDSRNLRKLQAYVILHNNEHLSKIPTDTGGLPNSSRLINKIAANFYKTWRLGAKVCNYKKTLPFLRLDKTFFANNTTVKYGYWFRENLKSYIKDIVIDNRTFSRPYWNPVVLERIVNEHINRKTDHTEHIFKIISFELFLRQFVDS